MDINLMVTIIEYIGTIAFAVSGALIAIENRMDILGVMILGSVTAVGGGLIRDILLNRTMPTMFENPLYALVAVISTVIVFVVMYILKDFKMIHTKAYKITFNIIDSLGLGVFVVVGAKVTMDSGVTNHFLILFNSVLTAVGGGIIRDILACRIPVIFRKHIYAVAAIIGAVFFYFFILNTDLYPYAVIFTILLVVGIRYLAFHFELNLPRVKMNMSV